MWLDRLGFYGTPVAATVGLHLLLVVFLTFSWPETKTVVAAAPKPQVIQAALVDAESLRPKKKPAAKKPPPKPATKPKPKPAPPKPKPKPAPPKPVEKPVEKPAPPPEPEKPSLTAEQLAALTRSELAAAIDAEPAPGANAGEGNVRDTVAALIQGAVINRWTRPPSARNGMVAILAIQLVPTGDVVGVTVLKSSGDNAFDRSAMTAVERVARFPEVTQLERDVFERDFRRFQLIFRPEDLRY